jgi:hypothetical protein
MSRPRSAAAVRGRQRGGGVAELPRRRSTRAPFVAGLRGVDRHRWLGAKYLQRGRPLGPARQRSGGCGKVSWATQRPIRRATRPQRQVTKPGSERDGVVNSESGVNARVREFWTEIPGAARDHPGAFRTPAGLARNGEWTTFGTSRVTSCGKGGKAKTPRGEPLGVFRELVCRVCTQNRNELPDQGSKRVRDASAARHKHGVFLHYIDSRRFAIRRILTQEIAGNVSIRAGLPVAVSSAKPDQENVF